MKLLAGAITWLLQVGSRSAKIQVLVLASPSPLLCHEIPSGQAWQIPLPCGVRPEWGLSRSNLECWERGRSTLGSLFLLEELEA